MGADEETYRAQQTDRKALTDFELYEENLESFMAFKQVMTQMRYVSGTKRTVPTGLDYSAVLAYLKAFYPVKKLRKEIMEDIQVIENEYIRASHE